MNATNFVPNRGSGGSTSKTASKTALKEQINYAYKNENGDLNKSALLKDLAYGEYSDAEVNAIISASGITQADITNWQKQYSENVHNYMFPASAKPISPFDIPLK